MDNKRLPGAEGRGKCVELPGCLAHQGRQKLKTCLLCRCHAVCGNGGRVPPVFTGLAIETCPGPSSHHKSIMRGLANHNLLWYSDNLLIIETWAKSSPVPGPSGQEVWDLGYGCQCFTQWDLLVRKKRREFSGMIHHFRVIIIPATPSNPQQPPATPSNPSSNPT